MTKLIFPQHGSLQTIHTPFQSLFHQERWQERSEKYLLSCGIQPRTLQSIRAIPLEQDEK